MLLNATTQTLELVTTTTAPIHYYVEYVDYIPGTSFTPAAVQGIINTATTTTILTAPAAGTTRKIKALSFRNASTTASNTISVQKDISAVDYDLSPDITLQPDENLYMDANDTWQVLDGNGRIKSVTLDQDPIGGVSQCFRKVGTAPEAAGVAYCYAKDPGFPGVWSPGTPGLNGRATDGTTAADAGCMPMPNAGTGSNWLTQIEGSCTVANDLSWVDVLWVNSGIVVTTTTAQAITSPTFPARDINGSSDGVGLCIGLLVTTATTNAAVNTTMTVSYTNQAGTAGRTARVSAASPFPATAVIGTWVPFQLDAGDTGVRSIQNITLGTSLTAGAVSLVVYKQYPGIDCVVANLKSTNTIPAPGARLYNGVVLLPLNRAATATTATTTQGNIVITTRA
jgi:hypothetical protein